MLKQAEEANGNIVLPSFPHFSCSSCDDSFATTVSRRSATAQLRAAHARRLRGTRGAVCVVFRPLSSRSRRGRSAAVSAVFAPCAATQQQHRQSVSLRPTLSLSTHPAASRVCGGYR